jgi:hypothetical protein
MIYSRPGYKTMHGENPRPAKLNDDMIPAINRKAAEESSHKEPQKLDLSHRKLKTPAPVVPPDVLKAAERAAGPELILNPAPSATPQVLEPGK